MGSPERGRRKLTFGHSIKHGQITGSGEGTVSPVQGTGSFLEEVALEPGLPVGGFSIWEGMGLS